MRSGIWKLARDMKSLVNGNWEKAQTIGGRSGGGKQDKNKKRKNSNETGAGHIGLGSFLGTIFV